MAIRVPQYETSVGPKDIGAPTPYTPSAPPPVAFGTAEAAATEKLGGTIEQAGGVLANHMIERQHQMQTAQAIQADNDFRVNLQKTMFDTTPGDNGTPKGVFNRQGFQANGATQEFDNYFHSERQKAVDAMDSPYKKMKLGELMDENYPRLRELVAKHEGTQMRVGLNSVVDGNIQDRIQNAPQFDGDASGLIKSIQTGQQLMHDNMTKNGSDPSLIAAKNNDIAGKIITSALRPALYNDPEGAQKFFDQITAHPENPLSPKDQNEIQKVIDDAQDRFKKKQKTAIDTHFNIGEAAISAKMANQELSLDDLNSGKDTVSPEYYNLATVALKNPPVVSDDPKIVSKQNSQFNSTLEKFAALRDVDSDKRTEEIMKLRKQILANSDQFSPKQFQQVLGWTNPDFVAKTFQDPVKFNMWKAGLDFIKEHYEKYSPDVANSWKAVSSFIGLSHDAKPEDVPGISRQVVQSQIYKDNPSMMPTSEPANNKIDKNGITEVHGGQTNLKPQQTLKTSPVGPLGQTTIRNGKMYEWSSVDNKYHLKATPNAK